MTMQIRSIILYNRAGAIREVSLKPGAVNIVTGRSLTGKSAIIDIVDYCMGRSTFNIPEGVIRDSVAWYAVVFRFGDNTEVLVAKPAPKENAASQSQVYYEVGTSLTAPPLSRLIPNSNDEAVVKELSKRVGIVPNLHMPPAGQSRNELGSHNPAHGLLFVPNPGTHRQQGIVVPPAVGTANSADDQT